MRPGRRGLARAALNLLAVIAILVVSAMTVQAFAEQSERAAFPPPGQMVDIGSGERIHIRTWGERAVGAPALILDASAGMPSSEWAWIGQMLGERHYLVAYDRPGMAWSDGPKRPRDAMAAASALRRALDAAAIEPPYVLVAHSYGGFSARAFAAANRDDVVALVLLDTTHPDGGGEAGFALGYRAQAWQAHFGLLRLWSRGNGFASLPAGGQESAKAVSEWTTHLDTTAEELEAWAVSASQIREVTFGDMPLLVVSAIGSNDHLDLQRDLLSLSTNSRFVKLNVGHTAMLLWKDQAQLTASVLGDFLAHDVSER